DRVETEGALLTPQSIKAAIIASVTHSLSTETGNYRSSLLETREELQADNKKAAMAKFKEATISMLGPKDGPGQPDLFTMMNDPVSIVRKWNDSFGVGTVLRDDSRGPDLAKSILPLVREYTDPLQEYFRTLFAEHRIV